MFKYLRPNALIVAGLAGAILAVVSAPQLSSAALAVVNGLDDRAVPEIQSAGTVRTAEAQDKDKKKKKKKKRRQGGGGSYHG